MWAHDNKLSTSIALALTPPYKQLIKWKSCPMSRRRPSFPAPVMLFNLILMSARRGFVQQFVWIKKKHVLFGWLCALGTWTRWCVVRPTVDLVPACTSWTGGIYVNSANKWCGCDFCGKKSAALQWIYILNLIRAGEYELLMRLNSTIDNVSRK